jgi:tetratricopeptide (TPR) repeat protein
MRIISITFILTLFVNLIFGQCDCDKFDQHDGTFYTSCKPILSANDSIGELKLGVSGLGQDRYVHLTISFKTNPQIINGGLTITTNNGNAWICVLIQRDFYQVNGVQTAYGLFVTREEELALMQNNSVKSISFYLADGKKRSVDVSYLSNNLANQLECLKSGESSLALTMEEYRKMASEAGEKEDYEKAISNINKAIQIDPNYIENYISKGFYLTFLNRYQEAYDEYSLAIKIDSSYSNSYDNRAGLLSQIGQYNEALRDYTTAIQYAESSKYKAQYLTNRGITKGLMRDLDGEYNDLTDALKLDSNSVNTLNGLGITLCELGRYKEALAYMEKGLKLDSGNYRLHINIGYIYQEMGDNISAIGFFNKAISINPKSPESYSNKSYSEYLLDKNEDALSDINKSLTLWDTNPYAYWIRAIIYIKQEKSDEACSDLTKAIEYGYTEYYGNAVVDLKAEHCKK